MSSEQVVTPAVAETPAAAQVAAAGCRRAGSCSSAPSSSSTSSRSSSSRRSPRAARPGDACAFPVCFIEGTLEFPAPHVVWAPEGSTPPPASQLIVFYPSISSTILTMWIVMAIVLIVVDPDGPRLEAHPRARPERVRVVLRVPERLRDRHRRPGGAAVHPAVRRVLPAHPVLQLERPGPAGRPDRGAARADERRQHHASGWPSSASCTSSSRASASSAFGGYARQVLPALRVQERDRRRGHRPVRRPRRAHARVRQAGHAVDATLRQHLRRRGRARRHHRPDDRVRPGRPARPRGHAQRHPGPHLQHPDPHVHRPRHREPRSRGGPRRRGGARGPRTGRSHPTLQPAH